MRFGPHNDESQLKYMMGISAMARILKIPYSTIRAYCLRYEKDRDSQD